MSETISVVRLARSGGTTDADLRAAARFALTRPGWRVEEQAADGGGTRLLVTTRCLPAAGERAWVVERLRSGLLVRDAAAGTALGLFATLQGALAVLWEAVTSPAD